MRSTPRPRNALRENPRFRRLADQLHQLGARPVGELIAELVMAHEIPEVEVLDRLERYGRLSPELIQALGGDHWPPTILSVEGSRR